MKERHIGQVSFNLLDEYEIGLFNHANKKEHGKFSQYIKRLIDRDLVGNRATSVSPIISHIIEEDEENVRAAGSFL